MTHRLIGGSKGWRHKVSNSRCPSRGNPSPSKPSPARSSFIRTIADATYNGAPADSRQLGAQGSGRLVASRAAAKTPAKSTDTPNGGAVGVGALVLLATVPFPQSQTWTYVWTGANSDEVNAGLCPPGTASASYTSSVPVSATVTAPNGTTIWSHQGGSGSVSFSVPSCGTYRVDFSGSGSGRLTMALTLNYLAPYI